MPLAETHNTEREIWQANKTSGYVKQFLAEPAAASTADIVFIEALGANWGAGSSCLTLKTTDTSVRLIDAYSGANNTFYVGHSGGIYCEGTQTIGGTAVIATTSNGLLTLLPNGSGYTRAGDAGTTSHSLATNDDMLVSGKLEVDGALYCDSTCTHASTVTLSDTVNLRFGSSSDTTIRWSTNQTPNSMTFAVGSDSNHFIVCQEADKAYDFAHAQQTNPTIFINSANQTATEWISIAHDQTDGVITTGAGDLKLAPATDVVSFGTYSTGVAANSVGYITIKDSSGNTRKVMIQS